MIIVSGGGGGGDPYAKNAYAVISVSYPAGQTCTCTNGTKTLKAENTLGYWVFNLPESGTWVVSSTDGTDTVSKSVSITTQGQAELVELKDYYLFKSGVGELVDFNATSNAYGGVTIGTDYIECTWTGTTTGYAGGNFITASPVDLSNYKTLSVDIEVTAQGSNGSANAIYVQQTPTSAQAASVEWPAVGSRTTINLNVVSLNGSYYIGGSNKGRAKIYNIYLH